MNQATQFENRHIVIVDEDPSILEIVSDYFRSHQYRVSTAQDGEEMRDLLADTKVDLVILDLGLPREDGIALTRRLRQRSDVGVIILTGREDDFDRVVSLEVGADDYVVKPVPLRELLASARSVMRRTCNNRSLDTVRLSRHIQFAGFEVDIPSRHVLAPDGHDVYLTTAEFDLLAAFLNYENAFVSRDKLLDLVYHRQSGPFDRSIDVLVGRLRRKLSAATENHTSTSGNNLIKTVRGVGYVLAPPVERIED